MKSIIDYTNKLKDFFAQKQALSNEVVTRSTLGAHNLFNISLEDLKNTNGSGTWSGNVYTLNETTFTVQSDMSIDVNNVSSATATFYLINFASGTKGFDKSKWFLDLCRSGSFKLSSGSALKSVNIDYYNGNTYISNQNGIEISVNVPQNADRCQVFFRIGTTDPSSGISLKTMIRLASDTDPTYQPYAMTNRELTDRIQVGVVTISDGNERVDFPKAFTSIPKIFIQPLVASASATNDHPKFFAQIYELNETRFRVICEDESGTRYTSASTLINQFMWMAVV